MSINYDLARRVCRRYKAALTRAQNRDDHRRVIEVCEEAFAAFDDLGAWPDHWALWQRAKEDAEWALRFSEPTAPETLRA